MEQDGLLIQPVSSPQPVLPLARRAAVVSFADIVGYSILAAAHEEDAAARWMAMFHGIVMPAAAACGGRIVDVQGDGTLAEFTEVSNALAWARALHVASIAADRHSRDEAPITFRVAIHVGNVMVDGERILGDTINVAARLQEYCVPGGILLSAAAAALLPEAERAAARPMGDLPLRNLSRSVQAISLDPERVFAVPLPPAPALLPSLAVLPLLNLSGDPRDDYLATGIIEDVTASLAGLQELFVIAPDSARMFQGQRPTPQRVARTLGVRFLMSGGLWRLGGGLLVSVRLSDGETGQHLWSERIEAAEREIFDVQDYVAAQIVAGVAPSIRSSTLRNAMRKRPESLTAYDHMLRGVHAMAAGEGQAFHAAREHLARAMAEDSGFALPMAWAAHWHSLNIGLGRSTDRRQDAERLFSLSKAALAVDPANALALAVLGHNSAYLRRDCDTALDCFERALAAAPSSAMALTFSSPTLAYLGRASEAVQSAERGLRLSPYDPLRFTQRHFLSIARYVGGDLDGAEREARVAIGANAAHAAGWRMMAAILGAQGPSRQAEAREAARSMVALEPGFRYDDYVAQRVPFRDPPTLERFVRDLGAALQASGGQG